MQSLCGLLSEVLVAAGAEGVGPALLLVWVTPAVAVWSVVGQVPVVVVLAIFKAWNVSDGLFWDTTARFFHSPVARGRTTAVREVRVVDEDAVAETTPSVVTVVVAWWSQVTFNAILPVQVDREGVAAHEHLVVVRGPVSRTDDVVLDSVEKTAVDIAGGGLRLDDLAVPVLVSFVWPETGDLEDVLVRVSVRHGFDDFLHLRLDVFFHGGDLADNVLVDPDLHLHGEGLGDDDTLDHGFTSSSASSLDGPGVLDGSVLVDVECCGLCRFGELSFEGANVNDERSLEAGDFIDNGVETVHGGLGEGDGRSDWGHCRLDSSNSSNKVGRDFHVGDVGIAKCPKIGRIVDFRGVIDGGGNGHESRKGEELHHHD